MCVCVCVCVYVCVSMCLCGSGVGGRRRDWPKAGWLYRYERVKFIYFFVHLVCNYFFSFFHIICVIVLKFCLLLRARPETFWRSRMEVCVVKLSSLQRLTFLLEFCLICSSTGSYITSVLTFFVEFFACVSFSKRTISGYFGCILGVNYCLWEV